jgi:hypothetical protein
MARNRAAFPAAATAGNLHLHFGVCPPLQVAGWRVGSPTGLGRGNEKKKKKKLVAAAGCLTDGPGHDVR